MKRNVLYLTILSLLLGGIIFSQTYLNKTQSSVNSHNISGQCDLKKYTLENDLINNNITEDVGIDTSNITSHVNISTRKRSGGGTIGDAKSGDILNFHEHQKRQLLNQE